MNIKTGSIRPSARYLPATLGSRDFTSSPLNDKFVVGLTPHVPTSYKSRYTEEFSTGRIETEGSDHPTFFLGKPIRLSKCAKDKYGFRSADYQGRKMLSHTQDMEPDDSDEFKKGLIHPANPKQEKVISGDESQHNILGDHVVEDFYQHYKKLDKVRDINNFIQIQDATYTSFLGKTESLQLLPSKIGFIREKGEANKIKLNHFRLGDKYAEVLSEGLKSVRSFSKIELANNRITPVGANHLLSKLTSQTEVINLSGNSIGKIGSEHLCAAIAFKGSRLLELNLEGNKLGDIAVGQICEALAYNNSIQKLNIGKNFLTDNGAEKIAKMLEFNTTLEELYLQWNQIKSMGGSVIVNGLKAANKLKILDFSWNSLGLNGPHFAKSFGSFIATNQTLVHLDLSNNYIGKQDAMTIAEDLKQNHTLYGFHFSGNTGYVDHKGFLIIPENWDPEVTGTVIQPPIDGGKFQQESLKKHIANSGEYKDVCWICEGWRPIELGWKPEGGETDPLYVHVSFEGYQSVYLPSRNGFKNTRMAPPIKFSYFFTVDGVQVHAQDQDNVRSEEPFFKIKVEREERKIKLDYVNEVGKFPPGKILDEDLDVVYELKELDIKPRIPDETYIPAEVILVRPPWKINLSIFKNYRPDTQALLDDCFKVDFEGTRISKLVKNPDDLAQVRDILYNSYKQLKDCYKYYAAVGAPSEIWSIPLNTYTDFCSSSGIIDGKVLKLSDFDRIFISTYTRSDKDKNHRNPDRALVRYQFLEGLVRIAEQKYFGTGMATSYADALNMLMNESVKPFIAKFDHHKWRPEKYWNEQVDIVYKSYLPIVRGIYKKYSGQKTLPGQKKFMCLEEFNRLMNDGELYSDNCGEREATIAFSLGMMTQVDELNSDRIYQMQFIEFLEALARVTDRISPHPYGYFGPIGTIPDQKMEMPYDQRNAQPLYVKLEGLMPILYSICGNDIKELWALPETSIFQMEEVPGKQRFPTKKKKILRINPTMANSIEPYDGMNALQV